MRRSPLLPLLVVAACAPRAAVPPPRTPASAPAVSPASQPADADAAAAAPPVYHFEPLRIDVVRTASGTEAHAYDARALLEDGNEALLAHRYDEALAAYDHLLVDFRDSRLVVPALYNAGLAHEGKRDFRAAVERYRRLLAAAPAAAADHRDAQFRLGAALAEVGQFAESRDVFAVVLDREDLSPQNRVEALARLGSALIETRDLAGAEEVLRRALAYHRELSLAGSVDDTYFVSMCEYLLADIPHRQFLAVPLRYPEEQLRRDLEQKSQLFLLARDRYIKTVGFKNPYWATAAVYEIALMYRQFWDDWMAVPVPANLTPEEAKLYVQEVNQEPQLVALLEKSLQYHERNLAMARNGNVETEWSDASRGQAEDVRRLLARVKGGDFVAPGAGQARTTGLEPGADGARAREPGGYVPGRVEL